MVIRNLIFYLGTLVALFSWTSTAAQSGGVQGLVTDGEDVLIGASVFVESTPAIGTMTNAEGRFLLKLVPVGTQQIVVSYIGYERQTVEVEVVEGEIAKIDIEMLGIGVEGEEVVISAQRRGQTQAINQQLQDDRIASIVSADKIQELPDVNAAEAIGRLPGVSLNRSGGEGQKVVIRGLEPKFSAITINGVRLPSNSSTDRSVDLSLIAPELLDGIEVFKSPLPDMDAEALGGTVNLRISKAPEKPRLMVKGLWGYNDLESQLMDYKGVVQVSNRIFENKVGVIAQGSVERFNRSGDFITYNWRQGRTDSLGNTEILGNNLRTEDRNEIRKRYNGSLALDYDLNPRHRFSFFGVYSQTDRDQFRNVEIYDPSEPAIELEGTGIENRLSLYSLSLFGEHEIGIVTLDWSLSNSRSLGQTPYNFSLEFFDNVNVFDVGLNADSHPRNFLGAANPDLESMILFGGEATDSRTQENTNTALVNLSIPVKIADWLTADVKVGGKYYQVDRERDVSVMAEGFYYLGGELTSAAAERYDGELTYLPNNSDLITVPGFISNDAPASIQNEDGPNIQLNSRLDPDKIRAWYDAQKPILNQDRSALVDEYSVQESILAGYGMVKIKVGDIVTLIPGFRYEHSDNSYSSGLSTLSGRYGVNGIYEDTTTTQVYGLLLPHLHLKVQPLPWLDLRASYAHTMARPDFEYITPRFQINQSALTLQAGNPSLRYALSRNYDLQISAYNNLLGLFTAGVFYKNVDDNFIPVTNQLTNDSIATAFGWPGRDGYEIQTYTNLDNSTVWGYELDLQTYFGFLPKPLNNLVLSVNYTRLFSATRVFFLTSETILIRPFPPITETIYTTETREVAIPSQPPHIFHLSLGYEVNKFSARVSSIFQGTQARSYSLNKDFDRFNLRFWRWDASIKQGFGSNWSAFINVNNFSNQRDISFVQGAEFLNSIQTYGMTATVGLQYKL